MTNVMHKLFSMCLFLFITLYMFRAHRAHHQERQIVSIRPLVTVIVCWWPRCVQVGRRLLPTCTHLGHNIEWQLPEAVLIQFVSPDDEHDVLETCKRVINRNKYIEKNLCITLVIYQESLHDARSTKFKRYWRCHAVGDSDITRYWIYNQIIWSHIMSLIFVHIVQLWLPLHMEAMIKFYTFPLSQAAHFDKINVRHPYEDQNVNEWWFTSRTSWN
jgi:hypothetical protein